MADPINKLREPAIDLSMATSQLPGRDALDRETLRALNVRSDWRGLVQVAGHAMTLMATGLMVYATRENVGLRLVAMFLHGVAIVTLFAPMHECVHHTAFRARWLNRVVGWIAGAASFNNSDYYRRFHHWHHRYTQDLAHDPELATPKPCTVAEYTLRISGLQFWRDKTMTMIEVSCGRTVHLPFVPDTARDVLVWSMRAQLALYLLITVGAVVFVSDAPLVYWLIPMLLGQPVLRAITLAEHTGCSEDANGLTNTRTTLTSWPVRFLMWNMPYHAEHHLYPSIPFHALPRTHARIRARLAHLDSGYMAVNRAILQHVARSARPIA
jgi:fatty acid desaturase